MLPFILLTKIANQMLRKKCLNWVSSFYWNLRENAVVAFFLKKLLPFGIASQRNEVGGFLMEAEPKTPTRKQPFPLDVFAFI